ncbi:MAG: hypothetical protein CMG64_06025 [Candidatus Marinimicrobia bacterium]|nr:hypothetical protein [Candidatus Neomarinimicrobiota bacterium]|tara:strand:+ start:14286 stop:15416 length:1131 start_codon:yes stop_codon:yes gene_type:complete
MKRILIILALGILSAQSDCIDGRYIDQNFNVNVEYQVEYGQNTNQTILGSEYNQVLYMDVYTPNGDIYNERPLIFFLFGGSFIGGSKSSPDIVTLCTNYAKMGYVAVAIDYRLSQHLLFFNANEENAYKAVMKAIHDLKAAIRYFKMDNVNQNNYKIDVDRVYVGGYSAGAVTSINAAYLNQYEEIPSFLLDDYDDFGGLEGLSGNLGYDSNFHGIVNLSGAVGDKDWIIEEDIPIVSMHGDQDDTVPYDNSLVTLFGLNLAVDGSYIIHERMLELGNYSSLHTYYNQGHSPYTNMVFETEFSSEFLYELVCSSNILSGDINQDDNINISDVVLLINYILNGENISDEEFLIADLNQDDSINVSDVVMLVNIILSN